MRTAGSTDPWTARIPAVEAVRPRVDEELRAFLDRERAEIETADPRSAALVDELSRLIFAGGKRLRPAFCYWGYRAAGGQDGRPVVVGAASLELLHTFALIHDDVMDRSELRRGIHSTHANVEAQHRALGLGGDSAHFGLSIAILAGDLASVLADRMFLESGFPPGRLVAAKRRYDAMRVEMAAGQFLDLGASARPFDEAIARRISSLKTGSYTTLGPLHIGASLAGGSPEVLGMLASYGTPLGEAFQVRDDLLAVLAQEPELVQGKPTLLLATARRLLPADQHDRLADHDAARVHTALSESGAMEAAATHVNALATKAEAALDGAGLQEEAADALRALARLIRVPEGRAVHSVWER
jgi:geranylgeranyl diphosphate synthase, type I